jgi:putative FmdB family regulatory protein
MPTYDYECTECGNEFEVFQSITKSKPVSACVSCGKMAAKRLIGGRAAVIFKGGGFYETENRSRQYIKDKQYDNRQARKSERLSRSKDMSKTQTVTQLN